MKRYRLLLLVILLSISFFSNKSLAQHCEDSTINLGTVDSTWLYQNKDLRISFQLPEGWYLYDDFLSEKKYLRIGSDYKKMSEVIFANSSTGPEVDLAQMKNLSFEYALMFLSLTKMTDTASVIISPIEIQQNYTVSLRAVYADTLNSPDLFLKAYYKRISGKNEDVPVIKDGKLGDLDYRYFELSIMNKKGTVENKIFGARNFGCVNMLIRIIYVNDADLATITDTFKQLKMVK
jgi:hypothetical protein